MAGSRTDQPQRDFHRPGAQSGSQIEKCRIIGSRTQSSLDPVDHGRQIQIHDEFADLLDQGSERDQAILVNIRATGVQQHAARRCQLTVVKEDA